MDLFQDLQIFISGSPIILFLGLLIILLYTLFIYRTTLPEINVWTKSILIFLRTLGLFLIFLLLFDPIINFINKEKIEPKNLIFADNSKSVKEISNNQDLKKIYEIIKNVKNENPYSEVFEFSSKIKKLSNIDSLKFNGTSTQFDQLFAELKSYKNVSSITIISDGINNQGQNPLNFVSDLNIPILTIGVGDTATEADIEIQKISANEFIYTGRETEIEASIKNVNFEGEKVLVQLIENQKVIVQNEITLSSTGINRIRFPYKSENEGEHKLIVKVISNNDEKNKANNSKSILINVLATKKKITIVAGSPSPDLSIVKSSLSQQQDYELFSIIQVSNSKFVNNQNNFQNIKNADILIFIGFPSSATNSQFLRQVENEITNSKKPFLFIFSINLDFSKLSQISKILPFTFSQVSNSYREIQVVASGIKYSLLGDSKEVLKDWEKLPPINLTKTKIIPSIESEILLKDNIANQPVLFTNSKIGNKIVVLTTADFWRWKLQTSDKPIQLLDNFLINSIKWLSLSSEDQQINLTTQKKSFKIGEQVIFNANYYDETLEPINNADLELEIYSKNFNQKLLFNQIGNGLYETEFTPTQEGIYKYKLLLDGKLLKEKQNYSFNVEPIELESITQTSNRKLLKDLSNFTNGKYYDIKNISDLNKRIKILFDQKINYKSIDNELRLSSLHLILLIVVLTFSLEWLIRKVMRML